MTEDSAKRKLRAILAADVVGYSQLMSEDEIVTYHALAANVVSIIYIIAKHKGRGFSSPNNAIMAEFALL